GEARLHETAEEGLLGEARGHPDAEDRQDEGDRGERLEPVRDRLEDAAAADAGELAHRRAEEADADDAGGRRRDPDPGRPARTEAQALGARAAGGDEGDGAEDDGVDERSGHEPGPREGEGVGAVDD